MAEVVSVHSREEFDKLTASHQYVIVDFWAEWCPPCKAIGPFFANLAKSHGVADSLAFAKVDIEEVPDVAKEFHVATIPYFAILKDGAPTSIDVGDKGLVGRGAFFVAEEDGDANTEAEKVAKLGGIRGADPKTLIFVAGKLKELATKAAE